MVVVGGHAKRDLRKREKRDTGKQYKGLYLPMKNSWSLMLYTRRMKRETATTSKASAAVVIATALATTKRLSSDATV